MKANKVEALEIDSLSLKKAALFFRAINHQLRQQILTLIHKNGTLSVTTIYGKLRIEQSVASQHLAILRRAKLVSTKRVGKKVFYSVNYQGLAKLQTSASILVNQK